MFASLPIKLLSVLALLAGGNMPNAIAQTKPIEVQSLIPASQWKVDYAERECRLTRTFGEKESAILFRLARGTSFTNYDIMLAGLAIPKQSKSVDIKVTIEPQNTQQSFEGQNRDIPNRKERVLRWFDGETGPILSGPKDQDMLVTSDSKFAVRLKMENFPAAIAAMQTCHDDLLKGWGIDGAAIRALKSLPEPKVSPSEWANTGDYPSDLLRSETGGDVSFKLDINAYGVPTDCVVIVTSKVEQLDKLTCKLMMQRAKFNPASGADGTPAPSHYINRVRWQIPN
jgi:outer membrane biosynthesis protein TonB